MELRRADPKRRLLVGAAVVAAAVAGVVVLALFREWLAGLSDLSRATAPSHLRTALAWCMGLLCLSLLAFAAYLWRLGAKVQNHAQFPLPGARMLRDTPVLRGQAAQRRGRWLQGLGVSLFIFSVAFAFVAWRLHQVLASRAP